MKARTDSLQQRSWRPVGVAAILALASAPAAHAIEFNIGNFKGKLETTLSAGVQSRTQSIDPRLVGTRLRSAGDTARTGTAFSVNGDDGNLNYENGLYSLLGHFVSLLDVSNGVIGGYAKVEGYYDPRNTDVGFTDHVPLSGPALEIVADNFRLLDAYIDLNLSPGNIPVSIRGGRHILNWGEGTFIAGGISTVNPFDVGKLRTPGDELDDALLPQGMVSTNIETTTNTSFEAFYQFEWEDVRTDRPGTFFSTDDFIGRGQDKFFYGFGDFSEFGTDVRTLFGGAAAFTGINNILGAPLGAGLTGVSGTPYGTLPTVAAFEDDWFALKRGPNSEPEDGGQYGVAFRATLPNLNDTNLGFFFVNYHSRLPIVSARTASAENTVAAASQIDKLAANGGATAANLVGFNTQLQSSHYFIEYPEDTKLIGASFNSKVGASRWSLKGEYSVHLDKPLQIDLAELFLASLSPLDAQLRTQSGGNLTTTLTDNQVGTFGFDTFIPGFIERDVSQIQATATRSIGPVLGADRGIFMAEVGVHQIHSMPGKNTLRLSAPGTNTSGNPAQAAAGGVHAGKPAEDLSRFPDATSWGYRMAASLDFNNLIGGAIVSPRVEWQHDVDGISPGPGGPFLEGRKAVSIGVRATIRESWEADLSWTGFFGAGRYNTINDRDFIAGTLKFTF